MATSTPRWNLFARELEDQLTPRGYALTDLGRLAGVQREEIRRLRRSLLRYESFPVLSVVTIARIITACSLAGEEARRLRAALVVASIQRLIFRRIPPTLALAAAEEMFPILIQVMRLSASSNIRIDEDDIDLQLDSTLDIALEGVFDLFDRATSDLADSRASLRQVERLQLARTAWYEYHLALAKLRAYHPTPAEQEAWEAWEQSLERDLALAATRLTELGATVPAPPVIAE